MRPEAGFPTVSMWRAWLRRWRLYPPVWVRPREAQATLFWAGVVGLSGGLSSLSFGAAMRFLQGLLTGHRGGLVQTAARLPALQRFLVPTAGGLLAGLVLVVGSRFLRGRRAMDFMEAIVLADGVMPVRPIAVRVTSSLLTIASGGSIGREGSMVQLAAMVASRIGQLLRLPTPRLRLLVACGVAAGIASAYRAPIAGSLFVAEIVLGSISMESFGPLVFAAVVATLTVQHFGERAAIYASEGGFLTSSWEVVPYLALGLCTGALAPQFLRLLRQSERAFARLPVPAWLRPALGGAVVGLVSLLVPQVWGNGQSVVNDMLQRPCAWQTVAWLLLAKLLATAATVGSGAVGGVFTPTLFVGAAFGLLFEKAYHTLWPQLVFDARPYALVGMGSLLAATTRAPLMAILMLFEMTLDYDIVLPLMLACVTAYTMATRLSSLSVYAFAMRRRGRLAAPPVPHARLGIYELMTTDADTVPSAAPLDEVAQAFAASGAAQLWVVGTDRRLEGAIAEGALRTHSSDLAPRPPQTATDLMQQHIPYLTAQMGLVQAAEHFCNADAEALPVVQDRRSRRLVGTVSKNALLWALAHGASPQRHT